MRALFWLQKAEGDFTDFLWAFVSDKPVQNCFQSAAERPSATDVSIQMSKALKKAGFGFVGPTICYAFMQATGMVNDHITTCYRHAQLRGE